MYMYETKPHVLTDISRCPLQSAWLPENPGQHGYLLMIACHRMLVDGISLDSESQDSDLESPEIEPKTSPQNTSNSGK